MKTRVLSVSIAAACLWGAAVPAATTVVDDQVMIRESQVARPTRGVTMAVVEAKFGAPQERHAAVGTPPITRWDYAGFSVYFERERVIHAVATGT